MRHRGVVELTQGILPIATDTRGAGGRYRVPLTADARTDAELCAQYFVALVLSLDCYLGTRSAL